LKNSLYLLFALSSTSASKYIFTFAFGNTYVVISLPSHIKWRDNNDKNKELGALRIAEDAIVIDTTKL